MQKRIVAEDSEAAILLFRHYEKKERTTRARTPYSIERKDKTLNGDVGEL